MFGLICVPHSHPLGIRGSKTFELLQRNFLELLVRAPRSICERAHRKMITKKRGHFPRGAASMQVEHDWILLILLEKPK